LRATGRLALLAGYAGRSAQLLFAQILARILPRRHWRLVRIGQMTIRIPPDWGEIEREPDGGYIIHNRPRCFRVEGDAVWYASAIELRIRTPGPWGTGQSSPMTYVERTFHFDDAPVVLTLAIANGVASKQRSTALRVLRSARAERGRERIEWTGAPAQSQPHDAAPRFHPRISGPLRS
jgi:hypothetical protein